MKVNDNRQRPAVPFSSIKKGEIFWWSDDPFIRSTETNTHSGLTACVCLRDGGTYWLSEPEWVRPLNAEVTIT